MAAAMTATGAKHARRVRRSRPSRLRRRANGRCARVFAGAEPLACIAAPADNTPQLWIVAPPLSAANLTQAPFATAARSLLRRTANGVRATQELAGDRAMPCRDRDHARTGGLFAAALPAVLWRHRSRRHHA